ncbi:hypothetical protein CDL12_12349 [Handroanthus impetiginosus]|uniref:Uncharacterized protein n=1 Tax=Handroanthus impetiginosus TaxID=429701 RepID=A0A2G9HC23_9LAMI|nr:hypothetical protein CDL12_12349 [Handroanthus impetiginosus]
MTTGEAEWPKMCFIFETPKPVDVILNNEAIEIFDDQSTPRPLEAHDRVPSFPMNVRRESPSPISSAFWSELPRIVGRSEVASQTPFNQTRSPAQRSRMRRSHVSNPSTGEAGCNSHASSATPKKPDRHNH